MRGKGKLIADRVLRVRITPAYAGKRASYEGSYSPLKDHPRLCGEK